MGVGELVLVVGGAEDVEAAVVEEGDVEEEEGVVSTLGIPSFNIMDSDDSDQAEAEANRGSQYHLTADTMFRYLL